ncbi:MAG: hypothetical protein ACLFR7_09205 [Opitutales bacterium]
MTPHFKGKRFDEHALPLEFLKDLAALEDMVIEVAKHEYLKENPQRHRTPRHFTSTVALQLAELSEGGVVARIALTLAGSTAALLSAHTPYFEEARNSIIAAISQAEEGKRINALPSAVLGRFDRFGRSLRQGEMIEFEDSSGKPIARLTPDTRRRLLDTSKRKHRTEEVALRGWIPAMDQDDMTFELKTVEGRTFGASYDEEAYDTIMEAFNGFRNEGRKVLLQGIGRYDRRDSLTRIESVDHITLLEPLDVPARLDEFKTLRDGWLDGGGKTPKKEALDRLADAFDTFYPDDLALPHVYPTPEGGVQAEWTLPRREISLEIDLDNFKGYWHSLDPEDDEDEVDELDMGSPDSWMTIADKLRALDGSNT